ncbi:MAG: thiamine-phosphate kinase [Candidatus Aminicenantales bacterium]
MKLRSLRERDLVTAIRKEFAGSGPGLILGIGDDAAILQGKRIPLLLTTDLLLEGIHFIISLHPPYELGRKSLNVNLSDIAAMGGKPRYVLLGLGLKSSLGPSWVEKFCLGFKSAADESKTRLIGGDISAAKNLAIAVTLIGEAKQAVTRSGAKPGDLIFVSGPLGDAAAGLRLLKRGFDGNKDRRAAPLFKAFLDPKPQLALGRALARRHLATSMIDLSDGLSIDLSHLCEESGTGAEIYQKKIPLSAAIRNFEPKPEQLALHGGEDYQLLFTVSSKNLSRLARLEKRFSLYWIGRMTPSRGIWLIDCKGRKHRLELRGYQHFRQ